MNEKIKLFIDNINFMASRMDDHARAFNSIRNILLQFPEETYELITDKQKRLLFSSFITLNRDIRKIKSNDIENLLKKLNGKLYGAKVSILTGRQHNDQQAIKY